MTSSLSSISNRHPRRRGSAGGKVVSFSALLVLAFFLFFLSPPTIISFATATIHLATTKDERRVVDLGTFAFDTDGLISLRLSSFAISNNYIDDDYRISPVNEPIGFVVDKVTSASTARALKAHALREGLAARVCFIDDPQLLPDDEPANSRVLFPLNGEVVSRVRDPTNPFNATVRDPGLYAIFFYNCRGFRTTAPDAVLTSSAVTFDATFWLMNRYGGGGALSKGSRGSRYTYLSVADQPLPLVFGFFASVFFGMSVFWTLKLARGSAGSVRTVHRAMLCLLVVKTCSLVFETIKIIHFGRVGHASGWDVLFYCLLTLKGMLLFTAVVLLGTGWSVVKSYLGDHEQKLLMLLLPSQVLINLLLAVIEETSEGNRRWQMYVDFLQLLDLACSFCVLLPLVWSMRALSAGSSADGKAASQLLQLGAFRSYYFAVVAYIYSTRIMVVVLESMLPFNMTWIAKFLQETIAVFFYVYSGMTFKPGGSGGGLYSELPTSSSNGGDNKDDGTRSGGVEMADLDRRSEIGGG